MIPFPWACLSACVYEGQCIQTTFTGLTSTLSLSEYIILAGTKRWLFKAAISAARLSGYRLLSFRWSLLSENLGKVGEILTSINLAAFK